MKCRSGGRVGIIVRSSLWIGGSVVGIDVCYVNGMTRDDLDMYNQSILALQN